MPTVPDIHQRGTRAAQPLPSTVTVGTLYFVTDEGVTERSSGAAWESYGGSGGGTPTSLPVTVGARLDGNGGAITAGLSSREVLVPFAMTITKVLVFADRVGSIVIDVWKRAFSAGVPTDAQSITGSAPITLSGASRVQQTTLTGWTLTVAADDCLVFHVDSASAVTDVTVQLVGTRT